jgi:hypothetical protein
MALCALPFAVYVIAGFALGIVLPSLALWLLG